LSGNRRTASGFTECAETLYEVDSPEAGRSMNAPAPAQRSEDFERQKARRNQMWSAIELYVRKSGGFVVSPMFRRTIRIEAPDSTIADKLRELGYHAHYRGDATRTGGPTGFQRMEVYEVSLP
jgi:hypothetical protein